MCFTICKRQVGVRSTALLNVMLTTERLNGDEAVGCGNYASSHIVSGPRLGGGVSCCWVVLPHARKTKLAREICIIKNTHRHVSTRHGDISIRQFKTFKSYPVFDLNYINRLPSK